MYYLNIFSTIKDWATTITDFFSNIKILFQNVINFFPSEILGIFIPVLFVICGLFVYRFVR